jgi:hypothetical protein
MMATRDFTGILGQTIDLAAQFIARPSYADRTHEIKALRAVVVAAAEVRIEGGRNPIGLEAAMLLDALINLDGARLSNRKEKVTGWTMIAGALLAMVRDNLSAALKLQKIRPTP